VQASSAREGPRRFTEREREPSFHMAKRPRDITERPKVETLEQKQRATQLKQRGVIPVKPDGGKKKKKSAEIVHH